MAQHSGCSNCLPSSVVPFHTVCRPPDLVRDAFEKYTGRDEEMDAKQLAAFMREYQGDETVTEEEAKTKIHQFHMLVTKSSSSRHLRILGINYRSHSSRNHSSRGYSSRGHSSRSSRHSSKHGLLGSESAPLTLNLHAFLKFLLYPELNAHRKPLSRTVTQDMTAPLSDYYIFASHNTYLTGNQLTSRCGTAPLKKALLNGCRVIELDCWDGKPGKIDVLHGHTFTKAVGFEECIETIKDHAFAESHYPVILTIESHLSQENQKLAAKILRNKLGELMFVPRATDRPPKLFKSPHELKHQIIISDKPPGESVLTQVEENPEFAEDLINHAITMGDSSDSEDEHAQWTRRWRKKIFRRQRKVAERRTQQSPSVRHGDPDNQDLPNDPEFEELLYIHCQKPAEMVVPHEKGGPLKSGSHAIMANLSEPQLEDLIKDHTDSLIKFSKNNLSRMYPFGLRFDSSNHRLYPMKAWRNGVQVVAVNMQGRDRSVWISKALFSTNGGCGYVKKPDILLPGSSLNYEDLANLPPKLELEVRVLLGTDWHRNYDVFKKPDYFVKVAVHGMYGDETKTQRTRVIKRSREPHWENQQPFKFSIRVPELAILRLEVKERDRFPFPNDMVGQSCVPVLELREGIRTVNLESKKGEPRNSKLLCHFSMRKLEPPVPEHSSP